MPPNRHVFMYPNNQNSLTSLPITDLQLLFCRISKYLVPANRKTALSRDRLKKSSLALIAGDGQQRADPRLGFGMGRGVPGTAELSC